MLGRCVLGRHRNDWSLPVATGHRIKRCCSGGSNQILQVHGRLDPHRQNSRGAAAEAGPGQTQLPQQTTDTYTPTHVIFLWRALGEMEEGKGTQSPHPEPAATLSQSPA